MKLIRSAALVGLLWLPFHAARAQEPTSFRGICDASAAVALDADHFVVADDERNTLMIYKRQQPVAVGSVDLASFLGTDEDQESDIEGSAQIGGRTYWIASHGRNKNAKPRPQRQRLFATESVPASSPPSVRPVGQPYAGLLGDLVASDGLKKYKLDDASKKAPEADGGLNIEGLASTPDGKLLVGFRSPLRDGLALIVPLLNPREVVTGHRAKLGAGIELDLGGRGIRSIERVGKAYLVVAGPVADTGSFALYRWTGQAKQKPALLPQIDFKTLRPEALFAVPNTATVQVLSDDGGVLTDDVECKKRPPAERSFRSVVIKPD